MNAVPQPCPESELLLHGLADGELDASNALAMESHLEGCATCTAAYGEILRQRQVLKNDSLRFRVPDALRGRVLAAIVAEAEADDSQERPRNVSWWRVHQGGLPHFSLATTGAALSAMALAASLLLFVNSSSQTPSIDSQLVAGHVRSLLVSHLTDVASSDQHTVKPWFLGKLDFAPPVVDLSAKEYPLVGGRLDYIGGHVVPALVYKRGGHVINLFVWPKGKLESKTENLDGYHIVSWTQDGFSYAAVSDLNVGELRGFQHALESALS
jgi:anti-sigma factor RsiW